MRSQPTMRTLCSRRILRGLLMHVYFQKVSTEWFGASMRVYIHGPRGMMSLSIQTRTFSYACTDSNKILLVTGESSLWLMGPISLHMRVGTKEWVYQFHHRWNPVARSL